MGNCNTNVESNMQYRFRVRELSIGIKNCRYEKELYRELERTMMISVVITLNEIINLKNIKRRNSQWEGRYI